MDKTPPTVLEKGQGQTYDWSQDCVCIKVPTQATDGRMTLVEDQLKPGFFLKNHYHKQMTEVFYILEGQVTFKFTNSEISAVAGSTVTVPPLTWHEVSSASGCRLLTAFSPGGFDQYLSEIATLSEFSDATMNALDERYDIFHA